MRPIMASSACLQVCSTLLQVTCKPVCTLHTYLINLQACNVSMQQVYACHCTELFCSYISASVFNSSVKNMQKVPQNKGISLRNKWNSTDLYIEKKNCNYNFYPWLKMKTSPILWNWQHCSASLFCSSVWLLSLPQAGCLLAASFKFCRDSSYEESWIIVMKFKYKENIP